MFESELDTILDLAAHNHCLGVSKSSPVTVGTCQLPVSDSCKYVSCIHELERERRALNQRRENYAIPLLMTEQTD